MKTPTEVWKSIKEHTKTEWKTAFLATFILGLLIHMPIMLRDIPNHDGLASMYFDQNMITSGRWFLTVACGFSSYFTLPWLIGLIGLLFLSLTSVVLIEFLEVRSNWAIWLISGLLAAFPALTSTFAYVFTLDGYLVALFLAVLSVLLTKRFKRGFLAGGLCLAFSLGTYQSYLAFAVLLCIYGVYQIAAGDGALKEKVQKVLHYLWMGIIGLVSYYVILQVLLKIQGKVLDTYQGINGGLGEQTGLSMPGMLDRILTMYRDFAVFTLKGNVFLHGFFGTAAMIILAVLTVLAFVKTATQRKWWRSIWLYVIAAGSAVLIPLATNWILFISPSVNYHLLMRYQWVIFPICMIGFLSRADLGPARKKAVSGMGCLCAWGTLICGFILVFHYSVTDQIAYSNLAKKYEKTYAYCMRLLDRIEQTEGYYQGIPIAMIGVVGDEPYPVTDITGEVTGGMIGMNGDYLVYTGMNYEAFIRNYLGATLHFLPAQAMEEMYYNPVYQNMPSFPAADSIRIMDGILYVKTENIQK